jgi:hypothetical protein
MNSITNAFKFIFGVTDTLDPAPNAAPAAASSPVLERLKLKIANNSINLEKGDFTGNVSKAMAALQEFCNQNKVKYDSLGFGYGELYINDTLHEINPYGIDIEMMLRFCGMKPENFRD